MTACPLPNPLDDDDSPTLRMRTLVLDRRAGASNKPGSHESGFWPTGRDPISDPDAAFATWQDDAMHSAEASMIVQGVRAQRPSPVPASAALASPAARGRTPVVATRVSHAPPAGHAGTTLSPDATLLPWRDQAPRGQRSTGSFLIALAFVLAAGLAGTIGFARGAAPRPVAIPVHVVRTLEPGIRELAVADGAMLKRTPAPSVTAPRVVVRRSRLGGSSPSSPANAGLIGSSAPGAPPSVVTDPVPAATAEPGSHDPIGDGQAP